MSFLQTFGKAVLQGVTIVEEVMGYAPAAEKLFPKEAGAIQVVSKDVAEIVSIVQDVEVIGQKLSMPGSQKLIAAGPLVAQEILKMATFSNRKVADEALFLAGSTKVADGFADILNSLDGNVDTNNRKS